MPEDYILKEYEFCFEQLRFYDERFDNMLKYLFTLTSAVAAAQFAVLKFVGGPTVGFLACQAFLSAVVFIATLLLYLAMLRNRLYFVYTARQVNAIRGFLMRTRAGDFADNQLYTSTDFPALKPFSVHTFHLIGAAFVSSLFAGLFFFALRPAFGGKPCVPTAFVATVIVAAAEIAWGIAYLSRSDKKPADEAIHGSGPTKPAHSHSATKE